MIFCVLALDCNGTIADRGKPNHIVMAIEPAAKERTDFRGARYSWGKALLAPAVRHEKKIGKREAEIFGAQALLLRDPSVRVVSSLQV